MALSAEIPLKGLPEQSSGEPVTLIIGNNGRVVIPKDLREAMAMGEDGKVTARIVDGELRLVSLGAALKRAQAALAPLKKPGESIVDEFLAERRAMWGEE